MLLSFILHIDPNRVSARLSSSADRGIKPNSRYAAALDVCFLSDCRFLSIDTYAESSESRCLEVSVSVCIP